MKLHFEPDLDYQKQAIEAVCDLFKGQETCRTEFTVVKDVRDKQTRMSFAQHDLGVGNRLILHEDEMLENLKAVQLRNGLKPADAMASMDFTVEMETGTGKTYVYLRTIFELNKRYGFTKFVIVVPSVAIKEGVYKTLQITEEHFKALYAGVPYEYFQYDSSKLGQVRNFATSSTIQIMVVTVGAINKKDVNNLYGKGANEQTGGEKPIDLIRQTKPIIVVDEPQSVDGGLEGRGKEALGAMGPLCTLRYSATHVTKHHMVYKLDAVDAYERKLVKQIEVAALTVEAAFNRPFVRLIETKSQRGTVTATLELDVMKTGTVQRRPIPVQQGDDLRQITGRDVYANFRVGEIRAGKKSQSVEIQRPGEEPAMLGVGQAINDVGSDDFNRLMIRRTIKEHLDKEKRLRLYGSTEDDPEARKTGIKVLSLIFIDEVKNYRVYDENGNPQKGRYAQMFEEEYQKLAKSPDYKTLFGEVDLKTEAAAVHDGYFSIDKKGKATDTAEGNQSDRDNAERAYNLIMKDKEKLLGFETKLKFIFSHSALREGWDNPNVFQICALREMGSERERRQTIGRGLRLCVNQSGERIRDQSVNTLTVIANEEYNAFAEGLQKELEDPVTGIGIRFGIVEEHEFATVPVVETGKPVAPLGVEKSKMIWEHLKATNYINGKGKVQDALRTALREGTLALPPEFEPQRDQIQVILKKLAGRLEIKNADERKTIKVRKQVLISPEFQALWNRIRHRTTYRVEFDNNELLAKCVQALRSAPPITRTRVGVNKAGMQLDRGGVQAKDAKKVANYEVDEQGLGLPDVLTELQNQTSLTRRSLAHVLIESDRLHDFKRNPQEFIQIAVAAINKTKQHSLIDGIKYQRLGDEYYYAQELFEEKELTGYLTNMIESKRGLYEFVVFDSEGVERKFAEDLDDNEAVKVYAKLPDWFTIPTPLGTYNPDWAVVIEKDGEERLYFVVETKSSLFAEDLRAKEAAKIACGKKHFEAIAHGENPAQFIPAKTVDDVLKHHGRTAQA
jgi:type III restriction enzyme